MSQIQKGPKYKFKRSQKSPKKSPKEGELRKVKKRENKVKKKENLERRMQKSPQEGESEKKQMCILQKT